MSACQSERNRCENCGDGMEHCGDGMEHCGDGMERGPGIWAYDFLCPNMQQRAITEQPKKHLNRIEPTKTDQKEL